MQLLTIIETHFIMLRGYSDSFFIGGYFETFCKASIVASLSDSSPYRWAARPTGFMKWGFFMSRLFGFDV